MKTIILPGYSIHNKDWAYEVASNLNNDQFAVVHEWKHWKEGSLSVNYEVEKIIEEMEGDEINLIAKSVGTKVTMLLIPKVINKINKVILCGIPTKFDNLKALELYTKSLKSIHSSKILCIQNTRDPFASYEMVKNAINSINPDIRVISKEASNHDYPYFEDFNNFLRS